MGVESLTPREVEVLALVAEGRSNKEIALALGLGSSTVKDHVATILKKLGAANRAAAAVAFASARRGPSVAPPKERDGTH